MSILTLFPALPALAWTLAALMAKITLTSALQVVSRARSGVFPIPEDARLMRGSVAPDESPFVKRCANVWRNDTENLPFFLAVALVHVLLGAAADTAQPLFAAYVVLRWVHTGVFLAGLQPWRALLYLAGLGVCWALVWQNLRLALALGV